MPGVDWIPGISQLKATLQFVTGDFEGAAQTQENFVKECPVVSQVTSVVQLVTGDADGALETQMRCLRTVDNVANGIPVVGHVKGAVHHMVGDHEGGNQALNAATRSTVVIGSGAAAALATGGLAAIPAGIAAGAGYDVAATVVTDKPQGYVAAIGNAIENPSAGSIFDAAAIPVGDGLAGYSGGQIANKISSQVQLNNLEAARAAQTDQLNSALFDEASGGAGGGGGMTSGQVQSLGNSINSLTAEINTIRHGTPQYWFDAKSGQITVDAPTSSAAVPIVGYVEDNDNENAPPVCRRAIIEMQENAIFADSYVDATTTSSNKADKTKILQQRKQQKPSSTTLREAYRRVPVSTREELEKLRQEFRKNEPNTKLKAILSGYSWLYVRMPSEFNYTGAIMVNNAFQGLLHSFVRHSNDWVDFIPGLSDVLNRISVLDNYLRSIRSAYDATSNTEALQRFVEARRQLDNDTYIAVQGALIDAQMDLHTFIQNNVTYANYLGEGANVNGNEQVYFKVKDKHGKVRVMVVCVSDQLFPSDNGFPDGRPIKTITTVFFITWQDYLRKLVLKKF